MTLIVAGIGTDVGKTVASAILCEALRADYWKPVQAGDLDNSDSHKLSRLVSFDGFKIWPEAHSLTMPMSPHAAAKIDAVEIEPSDFETPDTDDLVIELAGGLMVPFSHDFLTVDLAKHLDAPVVLVANFYLGSINHTLLSLDLIRARGTPLAGILFNGEANRESRDVILGYSQAPLLGDIPEANPLDAKFISRHAKILRDSGRLAGL